MLGSRALLLAGLIAAGGCSARGPSRPEILAVEPASGETGARTDVTIRGSFYLDVKLDFQEGEHSVLGTGFQATLGGAPLDQVAYLDHETLTATVPASLPPGTYALEVIDPAGRAGTLASAFTVSGPGGADGGVADGGPGDGGPPDGTPCTPAGREGPYPLPTCTNLIDDNCNGLTDGDEPSCQPFGPPSVIAALDSGDVDDDPSLTGDLLELYFGSDRAGGAGGDDIWLTTRTSVGASWSTPVNVAELNSPMLETTPEVSLDGLSIFIGSDRSGSQGQDVYFSTRATRTSPWSTPVRVPELCSTAVDVAASASPDLLDLVLESTRGPNADLFRSSRPDTASPWGMPMPIMAVNTSSIERNPSLAGMMGATLVFDSNRPGGLGSRDFYLSIRMPMGGYSAPEHLDDLSSAGEDTDLWMSPDFRYAVFTSNRDGLAKIYEVSR